MTPAEVRKRAGELKAVDVRALIRTSLPHLPQLPDAQLDQLQRVLDAAVINADVQQKYEELDRRTILGKGSFNTYVRDPKEVARLRPDLVLKQKVAEKPGDAVPLNYYKLLTPDALKPTSDNPDEAAYLLVVAEVYEHRGVWLVLDSSADAMTRNLNANDSKKWRVRLLLGKPGAGFGQIKSATGKLTREALLSVSQLGAGYYEWVHQGPTMKALKSALDRVSHQIFMGRSEHVWWSAHRDEYRIVSRISDKLGGADWPNERIWDQPHQIYVQALHLINDGKVIEAGKFAILAAFLAESCARAVHEYIDATTRGATRAVKILEVAVALGKIADAILGLIFVGRGLIRLLSRKGGQAALEGGAQRQLTGGQRQLPAPAEPVPAAPVPRSPNGTLKGSGVGPPPAGASAPPAGGGAIKPPQGTLITDTGKDLGNAIDYARQQVGLPARMERTLQGPLALAENAQFRKAHKEFVAWLIKNPNASLAEKEAPGTRLGPLGEPPLAW